MRVAVTGGSGFIGTNMIAEAILRGHEVVNYDIRRPRDDRQITYWRRVDILNRDHLTRSLCDFAPHVVVHLAARTDLLETSGMDHYTANTAGVANVLSALSQAPSVTRAIFASTMLVCRYGHVPSGPEDYCPNTLYGVSKVIGERHVRVAESHYTWTIVRPTSIWGPYCDEPYKPFLRAVTRGHYFHPGAMAAPKALGFVANTVFQIFRLLESEACDVHGKIFYLFDYPGTTIREWADRVQEISGTPPIRTLPIWSLRVAACAGDLLKYAGWKNPPMSSFRLRNMLTSSNFDSSALQRIVGTLPYTLEEGVRLTLEWLNAEAPNGARPIPRRSLLTRNVLRTDK